MPNINLIAERREEKKRLERLTRQLFFGLAASVASLVIASVVMGTKQLQMRSDLVDANQKMQKLQPILDRIADVEKSTNDILPKVQTLQSAKANTLRWRAVLQVISQSIPNDTYLSGLSASGTTDNTSLNLVGMTRSQSLVGDTMLRLKTHPLFDSVDLKYTQTEAGQNPNDPVQRVRFEIGTHLRSDKPPADNDKAKAPAGAPGAAKPATPPPAAAAARANVNDANSASQGLGKGASNNG